MNIKICFYGPTGSGKTTLAKYIQREYGAVLLKIAEPLYDMQKSFYSTIEKQVLGQDGELLQFFAQKIESESPNWLARTFLKKLESNPAPIIVNDDCRLNSYSAIKEAGFIFIRVSTTPENRSIRMRADHVQINSNHPVEQGFELFENDYEINNNASLKESFTQIDKIMNKILANKQSGWLTGQKIRNEVLKGNISIEPFNADYVNPNSYNYTLNKEIKRLIDPILDCKSEDHYEVIQMGEDGYILYPGECYLGSTKEFFGSNIYASLITGRSSIGRKFITNHITAGLIDQGFFGQITLEIVVHKPVRVYPNMIFGQIFWFTTFGMPFLYSGKYQHQHGPVTSRLSSDWH